MNNKSLNFYRGVSIVVITVFGFAGCKNDPPAPIERYTGPTTFVLEPAHNPTLDRNIELFAYTDERLHGLVPSADGSLPDTLLLTLLVSADDELWIDGAHYTDERLAIDPAETLQCRVLDVDSNWRDYQIEFFVDPGIPVFWIETADGQPIVSKDDYLDATLMIDPGTTFDQENRHIELEIRGRGNSTWGMPKKPYRIRFKEETPLLGFPSTRNWVLLANYADKTLLRNHVAFEMGNVLMSGFVPRTRFVEIYLNGQYDGVYHLTDQIRAEDSRVAIDELENEDTDPALITGGYLLEIDERLDADHWFHSPVLHFPFTFKSPESPNAAQREYLINYVRKLETIITDPAMASGTSAYADYIDVPSFVDFYLFSEVVRNNDSGGGGLSIYLHKPRGGKLTMGPIWDYDIALGNINYNGNENPEGWWIKTDNRWYTNLFNDPNFAKAVKTRWQAVKPLLETTIMEKIDQAAFETLRVAQQRNFQRWDILDTWVWPNAAVLGSYEAEVDYLKTWLQTRIRWMDGEVMKW